MADGNEGMMKVYSRDEAHVKGVASEIVFSYAKYGTKFYSVEISTMRTSGVYDHVSAVLPDYLVPKGETKGKFVEVRGQFRSRKKFDEDGKPHVELYLFAECFEIIQNEKDMLNVNSIYLEGYIGKIPQLRKTPSGRVIADLLIEIKNARGKYRIPCIAWASVAYDACMLEIGSPVAIEGRIQSREYFKKVSLNAKEGEYKTVQEVSISRLTVLDV